MAKHVTYIALAVLVASGTGPLALAQSACTQPAMIVFDGSGSMAARKVLQSRLESAKEAMARIVPTVSSVRPLGLVVYNGTMTHCDDVRLTVAPKLNSSSSILAALAKLVPSGATPLGQGVTIAANYFRDRHEPATLVVVTDGQESCGANICAIASELAASPTRIQVHVIGYDLPDSQPLRCLAERTGGHYTDVETTDQLTRALETALSCLDTV